MGTAASTRGVGLTRRRGFTLLEMVIAVTILASFVLPMLLILARSKVRTIRTQQHRQLRDLAQRKLFDRIHYYEENDAGDFTEEGRPEWTWEVLPPEMVGNGDQVLLQYTVMVHTPQKIEEGGGGGGDPGGAMDLLGGAGGRRGSSSFRGTGSFRGTSSFRGTGGAFDGEGSTFELSVWTFPDDQWYLEQEELANRGLASELYGDPNYR